MTLCGVAGLYVPVIAPNLCTNCGLCLAVCPTAEVDFVEHIANRSLPASGANQQELDLQVFGQVRSDGEADVLLGIRRKSYLGYAMDEELRWQASSGGLISALLIYALQEGLIDGALVTGIDSKTQLPKSFVARSPQEILEAMGSKYCVVPVNEALRTILENDGRYAVVCLPCQLHGLLKAQRWNRKLHDRVVYTLALVCSGTVGERGTHLLRESLELDASTPGRYRGNGWPGQFQAASSNTQRYIPFNDYFLLIRTYTPPYCFICWDTAGEFSDLSFGDAWLPEFIDQDQQGTSMVIARTERGQALLDKALAHRVVSLKEITDSDVLRARGAWKSKKQHRSFKLFISRLWYHSQPDFQKVQKLPGGGVLDLLRTVFWYTRYLFATNRVTRELVYTGLLWILRRQSLHFSRGERTE